MYLIEYIPSIRNNPPPKKRDIIWAFLWIYGIYIQRRTSKEITSFKIFCNGYQAINFLKNLFEFFSHPSLNLFEEMESGILEISITQKS